MGPPAAAAGFDGNPEAGMLAEPEVGSKVRAGKSQRQRVPKIPERMREYMEKCFENLEKHMCDGLSMGVAPAV